MGLGTSLELTDTSEGLFLGPRLVEVGESSWAGVGALAQVALEADIEKGVSGRCKLSSVEPSLVSGEADIFTSTSSDEPTLI